MCVYARLLYAQFVEPFVVEKPLLPCYSLAAFNPFTQRKTEEPNEMEKSVEHSVIITDAALTVATSHSQNKKK